MPSELLPFQRQRPFAWPIDPTASDPTMRGFWIAYAAAKCASDPSVEALWGYVCHAAYALRRIKEGIPLSADIGEVRKSLATLQGRYGRYLPRRCFHLNEKVGVGSPMELAELGAAIGRLHRIADFVDLLAEELVHGWKISGVQWRGDDGCLQGAEPRWLLCEYRKPPPVSRFPEAVDFFGMLSIVARGQIAVAVPSAELPMPWAAGLLSAIERTTGSCDISCPVATYDEGTGYLLRRQGPERPFVFWIWTGEDPSLAPLEKDIVFDDSRPSHPLFLFFGDDLPKLFAEYRAWRALADKPVFQDACKWHPDDDEIV